MDTEPDPNVPAKKGNDINSNNTIDSAHGEQNSDDVATGTIEMDDYGDDTQGEEKSQTFRQRRLTYTRSHLLETLNSSELQDLNVSDDDDEDANKGNTCNKGNNKDEDETNQVDDRKSVLNAITPTGNTLPDKDDEAKAQDCDSSEQQQQQLPLESRVLHASAPPIPNHCPNRKRNLLYAHQRLQESNDQEEEAHIAVETGASLNNMTTSSSSTSPPSPLCAEWKRRRISPKDEDDLPFPRHIVGTYSCHGIEPVYDESDSVSNAPSCIAKINQDRGGVAFPYANNSRMAVFAAYDGHGDGGEHVAQYALHEIPKRLEQHDEFLKGDIESAFKSVFVSVDNDLVLEKDIEPLYSGCTACVALLKQNQMYFSNAGDSRAVMASRVMDDTTNIAVYEALDLTVDQNPDSPGEQERIEGMGGFVSPPPEEGLSARVWLDCNYSQIGLAMSRSIGDHAVKSVGVIAEPVVTKHELREHDNFMIIATDGVWEFLSSQEAVDIVSKDLENGKGSSVACQNLIEAAAAMWEKNEGDYRDDITALVIKVKELWED